MSFTPARACLRPGRSRPWKRWATSSSGSAGVPSRRSWSIRRRACWKAPTTRAGRPDWPPVIDQAFPARRPECRGPSLQPSGRAACSRTGAPVSSSTAAMPIPKACSGVQNAGMNAKTDFAGCTVGYDIPALPGMAEADIQTPCLILDLDALERNIRKMGDYARAHGMRHRSHGKMHKSVDVQELQERLGGAVGICCQKVSEAEVFARGGIKDILVSNQVRDPLKIDRLAQLP